VAEAIAASRAHVARTRRFESIVLVELREPLTAPSTARDADAHELAPTQFTVEATHNPADIAKAFDGDAATRWGSGSRQGTNEAITLAFAETVDLAHLRLDLGARSLGDYPRGLLVESSIDGQTWHVLFGEDILPRLGVSLIREPRSPGIDVPLPANRTRLLRLRTTGETRAWFWSIHELKIWAR
jgi:hypothetical protein